MELVNFDNCEESDEVYEGKSGDRIGIIYNNENYLLKFPGNLKNKELKNTSLDYSNSPLCEYIGSHIYEILGFPVHQTQLGIRNNKIVVVCKDFKDEFDRFQEFGQLKAMKDYDIKDSNGKSSSSSSSETDLQVVLTTIDTNHLLKGVDGVKERFWDMFVIDALIGNGDRNNKNWGILLRKDKTKTLAPVYDNGNCLCSNRTTNDMQKYLSSEEKLNAVAFNSRVCIFTLKDKKINPYHYIERHMNPDCDKAVMRNVPNIKKSLKKICDFIDDIPEEVKGHKIISHIQKKFYTTLIKTRFEKVIEPAYRRIIAKENKQIAELKEKSVSAERHFTPEMLTGSTKTPELPSPAKAPIPGRRGIGEGD